MKDRSLEACDLARRLRQKQTRSEARLWSILRGRKVAGAKFRRQVPLCGYVVDFACLEAWLVLEVDGGIHSHPAVMARDAVRQRRLERFGWRVVRLSADDAMDDLAALSCWIAGHVQSGKPTSFWEKVG